MKLGLWRGTGVRATSITSISLTHGSIAYVAEKGGHACCSLAILTYSLEYVHGETTQKTFKYAVGMVEGSTRIVSEYPNEDERL